MSQLLSIYQCIVHWWAQFEPPLGQVPPSIMAKSLIPPCQRIPSGASEEMQTALGGQSREHICELDAASRQHPGPPELLLMFHITSYNCTFKTDLSA